MARRAARDAAEKWGVESTEFVWLSSGINDIRLARQPGETADALPAKFVECHVMLLRNLFRVNPALHVVHFGYDLLCSPSFLRPACVRCGWGAPANASLLVEDQCDDDGIRKCAACGTTSLRPPWRRHSVNCEEATNSVRAFAAVVASSWSTSYIIRLTRDFFG